MEFVVAIERGTDGTVAERRLGLNRPTLKAVKTTAT
jgi:hypothetical protein